MADKRVTGERPRDLGTLPAGERVLLDGQEYIIGDVARDLEDNQQITFYRIDSKRIAEDLRRDAHA